MKNETRGAITLPARAKRQNEATQTSSSRGGALDLFNLKNAVSPSAVH
jgi:hypothetical protein